MDRQATRDIPYNLFLESIHRQVELHRLPITGSIEVTSKCNLRCGHCYLTKPDPSCADRELDATEFKRIIDEISDQGCLWLLLTGGEPFLRDDFPDLYTYAIKRGLLVTIFTNGTLITPELADLLAEWTPGSIEITLYGHSRQTYETVTGVKGSHHRSERGIELLLERNLPVELKSTVTRANAHELTAMKEYARRLGVPFRFDAMVHGRLDRDNTPLVHRLSPEEVVELDVADEERLEGMRAVLDLEPDLTLGPEYLYHCGAGKNTFHIDACGRLSICIMSRTPSCSLRDHSFRFAWEEFVPGVIQRKRSKPNQCWDCRLRILCESCPGWGELEMGDPEAPSPHACEVAQLRFRALGERLACSSVREKDNGRSA